MVIKACSFAGGTTASVAIHTAAIEAALAFTYMTFFAVIANTAAFALTGSGAVIVIIAAISVIAGKAQSILFKRILIQI